MFLLWQEPERSIILPEHPNSQAGAPQSLLGLETSSLLIVHPGSFPLPLVLFPPPLTTPPSIQDEATCYEWRVAGHGASHHGDGSPQLRLASKSHENPGKLAEVFIETAADAFMETGLYLKLVLKPPCLQWADGMRVWYLKFSWCLVGLTSPSHSQNYPAHLPSPLLADALVPMSIIYIEWLFIHKAEKSRQLEYLLSLPLRYREEQCPCCSY